MTAYFREFAAPANFAGNVDSDQLMPWLESWVYKTFTQKDSATALLNEMNRGVLSTLIPGKANITNMTAVGTTVTVTTDVAHSLTNGKKITVSGATPSAYNASEVAVSGVTTNGFSYTVASAPGVSPATSFGIYSPVPTFTADSMSVTANAASPATGINTGIVITGDVSCMLLTQKTGAMGIMAGSLAASNSNIIGFQGTSTQIQFHNGNSAGSAANFNWPADIGTKKLFAFGWGKVRGFPHMAVGLNGVLTSGSSIVTGSVAGGARVPTPGDHVMYFARPNGGNGVGITTFGAIRSMVEEESVMLSRAAQVYAELQLLYPGTVY